MHGCGWGRLGDELRAAPRCAHCFCKRVHVVCAVVAAAVDEERRRSRDAARIGAGDVLGDALGMLAPAHFPPEAIDVEADLRRDSAQLLSRQCLFAGERGTKSCDGLQLIDGTTSVTRGCARR